MSFSPAVEAVVRAGQTIEPLSPEASLAYEFTQQPPPDGDGTLAVRVLTGAPEQLRSFRDELEVHGSRYRYDEPSIFSGHRYGGVALPALVEAAVPYNLGRQTAKALTDAGVRIVADAQALGSAGLSRLWNKGRLLDATARMEATEVVSTALGEVELALPPQEAVDPLQLLRFYRDIRQASVVLGLPTKLATHYGDLGVLPHITDILTVGTLLDYDTGLITGPLVRPQLEGRLARLIAKLREEIVGPVYETRAALQLRPAADRRGLVVSSTLWRLGLE